MKIKTHIKSLVRTQTTLSFVCAAQLKRLAKMTEQENTGI